MADPEERNKAVIRQYIDAYNSREKEPISELFADSFVYDGHDVSVDDFLPVHDMWWTAFPNITLESKQVIAEDDLVASRDRVRGTHEGEYHGIEPTGSELDVVYMTLWRIKSGEIVRVWPHFDKQGYADQLGEAGTKLAGTVVHHLGK